MAKAATKNAKSIPRYLQVAGELREAIMAGRYSDGRSFPTESDLCEVYDVSRFTVREALKRLQAEGLIARKRGSGTVVQPAAARGGALHQPLSNVGELLQYARGSAIFYEKVGTSTLPQYVAEQVERDTSGNWEVFSGLRRQGYGEQAIARTEVYFHERLGDAVGSLDLNASSQTLFSQIEQLTGIAAAMVTQDIQAIAADKTDAESLEIEEGAPVLLIIRSYIDAKGEVFEISVSHHPGDRFAYNMHIDVEG